MNKIKILLCFLFTPIILTILFTGVVKASDQTITCGIDGCSGINGSLFNETNIAPGDSITRTLHVLNTQNSDSCNLMMKASTPEVSGREGSSDFTARLFTVIKDGINDIYGERDGTKATNTKTLDSLSPDSPISLGVISAGTTRNFDWTVYFDNNSGNNYQEANTKFDLNLEFDCGTSTDSNSGSVSGASATASCSDTAPSGAPRLLSITPGTNSAILSWTEAPDPVSYYLLAYGTSPGVYQYGNPNVGGKGTTSYTVNNLSGGTTYYFVVRAGNGCSPGPFSNEISVTPTGGFVAGLATGFSPEVLGSEVKAEEKEIVPQVSGADSCSDKNYWWWLPLVIQLIVGITIVKLFRKKQPKIMPKPVIVILGLALISQIIHLIFGCNCVTNIWCLRYWILNIIVSIVTFLYLFILFKLTRPIAS